MFDILTKTSSNILLPYEFSMKVVNIFIYNIFKLVKKLLYFYYISISKLNNKT